MDHLQEGGLLSPQDFSSRNKVARQFIICFRDYDNSATVKIAQKENNT
jgi:hypothetical protein